MPVERPSRRRGLRSASALALLLAVVGSGAAEAALPTAAATSATPTANAPPTANPPAGTAAQPAAAPPAVAPSATASPAAAKPLDLELLEFLAEFSDADGFADPFVLDGTVNRSAAEALDEQIDEERKSAAKAKAPTAKAPQEDDDGR